MMPSFALCCFHSSTASTDGEDDDEDSSAILRRHGGDQTASSLHTNSSIQTIPSLPSLQIPSLVSSSSHSTSLSTSCNFSLLSSLNTPPSSSAAAMAVSSHSSPLLYCATQSEITIHDLADLRHLSSFKAAGDSSGSIKSLAFCPDGNRLFTAHQDRRVRVWSTSFSPGSNHRHRLVASLPTVPDRLRRFAFPGNYVAVRRHRRRLWIEHADAVSALAAGSGGVMYSASWDKTIKVWRAASNLRCLESISAHDDAVNAVAVAPDGTVYSASADRKVRVWARSASPEEERRWVTKKKKKRHALVATLERHRSAVNALALSPDGTVLYSGACDRSIVVWEREESAGHMAAAGVLRGHGKAIMCLATVDSLLISGSTDRTVRIWRRGEDSESCTQAKPTYGPSYRPAQSDNRVNGLNGGGSVKYQCLAVLTGHRKGVRSVVACRMGIGEGGGDSPEPSESRPAEYRVCSGSVDGEVRVWRVTVHSDPVVGNERTNGGPITPKGATEQQNHSSYNDNDKS